MLLDYLVSSPKIKGIIEDKYSRIAKSNQNFNIYTIAADFKKNSRTLFVVLPTLFEAQKYYDLLQNIVDSKKVLFYPVDEMVAASLLISSYDFKFERINTIVNLLDNESKIVVTNINGALRGNLNKRAWIDSIINFEVGYSYNIKEIKTRLVEYGYSQANTVTKPGEFCYRGSVVDFYPITTDKPVRLDFFDDELESIKLFDSSTQLSILKIKEICLFPFSELFYSDSKKEEAIEKLTKLKDLSNVMEEKEAISNIISKIDLRNEIETVLNFAPLFEKTESIIDFVKFSKIYIINEEKNKSIANQIYDEEDNYFKESRIETLSNFKLFIDYDSIFKDKITTYIDTLIDNKDSVEIKTEEIPSYYGSLEAIIRSITPKLNKMFVMMSVKTPERLQRLKEYFRDQTIQYKTVDDTSVCDMKVINFIPDDGVLSLSMPKDNIFILAEDTLYKANEQKRKVIYKSTFNEGQKITTNTELNPGDYIVHMSHGIGYYEGIKTIELSGKKRDYLSIKYKGEDHLYIPIEQLDLIKKYVGHDGRIPELTKLGSSSWNNTKARVKAKVLELGKKLVELYAKREAAVGFAFDKDSTEQIEFESEFQYEETRDQQSAIEAVKHDMESTKPMDRLICGDVGYGKTEIALRAAFKAVMSGKQVCYLAPTTILTRQHYHTFKDRMDKYGINVKLLNRFVSQKEIKKILKDLEYGTVDILIGTHRVLSDDVKFKDLGLLITDEEQRFGVMHKEKIKEMKVNVDSLMLTATPIPRTLQMSLVGIKELSLIETPPKNRYPVQTYVTPRHDSLVKEAIERELLRDGQVFYLYNYVDDIEDVAYRISQMVPEARVCYAHGKMEKNHLEEVITDFLDKKYNVLVSTTIIETGIDIPEANTLIIHDADRLGLSQLYQIRGRVGRSDRIAYAYLMYEPRKILTTDAEKRLSAIKEFTELGSGFKIAMRDLAIRGAGDLLGQEQSGFIDSVGLDAYMQILDDTLKEMRGEHQEVVNKPTVNNNVISDRYIPENYELSESLKIEIHNKINNIETMDDFKKVYLEFNDRFGRINESLESYMYEKLFNHMCNKAGVENVLIRPKLVTITLSKDKTQASDGEHIYRSAYSLSNDFTLSYKDYKISAALRLDNYPKLSWLKLLTEFLSKIM